MSAFKGLERFENISSKMNLTQKVITGITVGLILFVITVAIAASVSGYSIFPVWVIFLAVVGYFEYKLFS